MDIIFESHRFYWFLDGPISVNNYIRGMEFQEQNNRKGHLNFVSKQPAPEIVSPLPYIESLYQHINLQIPNIRLEFPQQVRRVVVPKPKCKKREVSIEELMAAQGFMIESRRQTKNIVVEPVIEEVDNTLNPENERCKQESISPGREEIEYHQQQVEQIKCQQFQREEIEEDTEQIVLERDEQVPIVEQTKEIQVTKQNEQKEQENKMEQEQRQELGDEREQEQEQEQVTEPEPHVEQIKQDREAEKRDYESKSEIAVETLLVEQKKEQIEENKELPPVSQKYREETLMPDQFNINSETLRDDQGGQISPIKVTSPLHAELAEANNESSEREQKQQLIKPLQIQTILLTTPEPQPQSVDPPPVAPQVKQQPKAKKSFSKVFVKKTSKKQTKQSPSPSPQKVQEIKPSSEEMQQKKSGLLKNFFKSAME